MSEGGGDTMAMVKMLIQVPQVIKAKLDALRKEGTTASGLIRHLLEKHFNEPKSKKKEGA